MAIHGGVLRLATGGDGQIVDLTEGVRSIVRTSGVSHGVAVTTMEHEPGGVADLTELLEQLIPRGGDYEHNRRNADTNAHAHLRAALIGPSESIPVVDGALVLGTWQQIVLVDFDDRPREREIAVQLLS